MLGLIKAIRHKGEEVAPVKKISLNKMDEKMLGLIKAIRHKGEEVAPVKKISLKVKFQKALEKKKKGGRE